MRLNQSKKLAHGGRLAIGTMCNAASPLIGEWLGHSGYDFVVVDLQHGENNLDNVSVMRQALSSTPATPVVRVPANVPMYIQRVLDLGAYGIIVPLVNTKADAEAVVARVGDRIVVRLLSHRGAQLVLTPAAPDEREVMLGPMDDFAIAGTVAAVLRPLADRKADTATENE